MCRWKDERINCERLTSDWHATCKGFAHYLTPELYHILEDALKPAFWWLQLQNIRMVFKPIIRYLHIKGFNGALISYNIISWTIFWGYRFRSNFQRKFTFNEISYCHTCGASIKIHPNNIRRITPLLFSYFVSYHLHQI